MALSAGRDIKFWAIQAPVVVLAGASAARDAEGWNLPRENGYWIVLPVIALWPAWGL